MSESIISRDHARAKAAEVFMRGGTRDDHNMNWHAAAVPVFQAEYDRLAQCALQPTKCELVAKRRVDIAQGHC